MGKLAQTAPSKSGRAYGCKFRDFYQSRDIDDEDRAAIDRALRDETLSVRAVAIWLGFSEGTISKHRKHECRTCSDG